MVRANCILSSSSPDSLETPELPQTVTTMLSLLLSSLLLYSYYNTYMIITDHIMASTESCIAH